MERVTDIFDQDTQGQQASGDLDTDLANAGHLLQKIAEEEGIDLSSLSDKDVADLVGELIPQQAAPEAEAPTTTETRKEAAMSTAQTPAPATLSYADVAVELQKIAAERGIDLTKVAKEQYTEAFNELADRMASPDYGQVKQAAEEEQAKLAEAYAHGQRMADGFLDRLKLAEDEESKAKEKHEAEEKAKKDEEEKGKKEASSMKDVAAGAKLTAGAAKDMVKKHMGAAHTKGKELVAAVGEHASKHKHTYGAGGVGAAIGAAGGAMAASRKKEALDAQAAQVAREIVEEMGIDPSTGMPKVAAAPADDAEPTAEEIAARAAEMLKEAGYLPKE